MSVDIYLFSAIRLYHKIAIFTWSQVQFLPLIAENGTISSKLSVHKIQKVKILCRMDAFWLPCAYMTSWYGFFLSRRTLGLVPFLAASHRDLNWKLYIYSIRSRIEMPWKVNTVLATEVPQRIDFKLIQICYFPNWTKRF